MYLEILELMECPECHHSYQIRKSVEKAGEIISGTLQCQCSQPVYIKEGVVILNEEEQEGANQWKRIEKLQGLEELDKKIAKEVPDIEKKLRARMCQAFERQIAATQPKFLVDIATGRGMLISSILQNQNLDLSDLHVICTDLSPTIMLYDRKKHKSLLDSLHRHVKISYIACDALQLPFKSNSLEFITSMMGYSNMGAILPSALEVAYRVLSEQGDFWNAALVIQKESTGFQILQQFFKDHDQTGAEANVLQQELQLMHQEAGFADVDAQLIGEGIGGNNKFDLLPVEGEWFGMSLFHCKK